MVECPTCGREFDTELGMKQHHAKVHGESLAGDLTECRQCGGEYRRPRSNQSDFCSRDCYGEWLSENIHGESHHQYNKVEVKCANCGAVLKRIPARVERGKNHFCDMACSVEWRSRNLRGENHPNYKDKVTIECRGCGEPFEVIPSRADTATYCSMECVALGYIGNTYHKTVDDVYMGDCHHCGEEVYKRPSYPDVEKVFCDSVCHNKWQREFGPRGQNHWNWLGGHPPYGPGWNDAKKEAVRERDDRRCQACGMSEREHIERYGKRLDVHHIIPAREGGSNNMDNLVSLCRPCHIGKWEGIPLRPQLDD